MNILITGASEGIGYETVLRFASDRSNTVFALARREEKLAALAAQKTEGMIIPVVADLSAYDFTALTGALTAAGVSHLDIVIHNAGLLINKPFAQIEAGEWETIYKVNLIGPALLTRELLPYLGGAIPSHLVTIGSIGGVRGSLKFPGLTAYSSSKGALGTLTECLAEEFKGRNIAVNCLALGSVQTEMLTKAFPGYTALTSAEAISRFIYDFSVTGGSLFNGKILEVSSSNP